MTKRKPHNPVKRFQRQAEAALSGLVVGMLPGANDGQVWCWRLKDGKKQFIGPSIAEALGKCCFKFAILLAVESQERNGKIRLVTHYERLKSAYRHSDIVQHLNAQHGAILEAEAVKGNEVLAAGWLCCPVPNLPDDEMLDLMVNTINKNTGE